MILLFSHRSHEFLFFHAFSEGYIWGGTHHGIHGCVELSMALQCQLSVHYHKHYLAIFEQFAILLMENVNRVHCK
jgi:hypothetical protein